MSTFNFTITREIEYSDLELLADVDEELPFEEEIELEVDYNVYGDYKPATWGYYGGEPAEYPELEIERIVRADTNAEIDLTPYERERVEEAAWEDAHARKYDY